MISLGKTFQGITLAVVGKFALLHLGIQTLETFYLVLD
jgi:hypothetical protein